MKIDVETLLEVIDKLKKEEPLLGEKAFERIRDEVENLLKRKRNKKINEILR